MRRCTEESKIRTVNKNRKQNDAWLVCLVSGALFCWPAFCKSTTAVQPKSVEHRTIQFRNDVPTGLLSLRTHYRDLSGLESVSGKALGMARGTVHVDVPADCWLSLETNGQIYTKPDLLESILPPGSIDALRISLIDVEEHENKLSPSDQALKHLSKLNTLKYLNLHQSDTTDEGLKSLPAQPNLEILDVSATLANGSFLKDAAKFPHLKVLTIYDSSLNQDALKYLPAYPELERLEMHHSNSGAGIKYLQNCHELADLHCGDNPKVNDDCMKYLLNLKKLKVVSLEHTGVTAKGVLSLKPLHLSILFLTRPNFSAAQAAELLKQIPGIHWTGIGSKTVDADTQDLYAPLH